MPELFGIFNSSGLKQIHQEGFSRMHAAFSDRIHFNILTKKTPCLLLALVLNNKHDSQYYCTEWNDVSTNSWIGNPLNFDSNFKCDDLYRNYFSNDFSKINDINSPFCSVISSLNDNQLWITSDHFGHYPIYYTSIDDTVIFSTKPNPILSTKLFSWEPNLSAIIEFFTYEHVLRNKTFVKNVSLVPPGAVINFKDGKSYKHIYLDEQSENFVSPKTTPEIAEALFNNLQSSIRQACKFSKQTAITLSGGLDSRAILGCALDNVSSLSAYTFGPENSADVQSARKLALKAGISHNIIPISGSYLLKWLKHGLFTTGGMVSCIHYQILSLADALAQSSDLVLDGLGGDMFTGAHLEWPMIFARTNKRSIEVLHRQRARTWVDLKDQKRIFNIDFLNESSENNHTLAQYFDSLIPSELWRGCHNFDFQERQRRFIQYGPHQIRSFVPVHTPFYDHKFSITIRKVSIKHLLGQRAYRYMHKHYLNELASIPDATGGVPVSYPASIRFSKRVLDFGRRRVPKILNKPFGLKNNSATNYPDWFRNELQELVYDCILGCETMRDYIDMQSAETMLEQHMNRDANHSTKIGVLLTFSAWLQESNSL